MMDNNNDEHGLVDQVLQDFVNPWQAADLEESNAEAAPFDDDGIPLGVESDVQHLKIEDQAKP